MHLLLLLHQQPLQKAHHVRMSSPQRTAVRATVSANKLCALLPLLLKPLPLSTVLGS